MLANQAQASEVVIILNPVSAANTAAATSAAIDIGKYVGDLMFTHQTGAITGSIASKIQHCDTSGGSYTDVTGGGFTNVSAANKIEKVVIARNSLQQFIKYVGTVTTGPVLISVHLTAHPKYV